MRQGGPRLRPWLVPLAVGALVQIFVLRRIAGGVMASYGGGSGAQFHIHAHRLWAWMSLRRAFGGHESPLDLALDLDGDYPPLLHVVTGLMIAPFDHSLTAASVSGMVWVWLLAASVGVLATRLPRGGRNHVAGAAAATGILLLPSLQAFSARYYYDIPMTALLWAGLAVLVWGWDRADRRGAVVAGVVLAAAALIKWTAVPFGGLMGLGLLWMAWRSEPDRARVRVRAVLWAGSVAVGLVALYALLVSQGPGDSSLQTMSGTFAEDPRRGAPVFTAHRLAFYPVWVWRSVTSPALAVVGLPLLGLWAARSRVGAALVVLTVLGQVGWLVATVPILDERFALTLVPALALAAALGFGELGRPARLAAGLLIVVVGLGVSWDAHFGRPGVFQLADPQWRLSHWRKLGMGNARNPDGGWTRGDAPGQDCAALRERMWDVVQRCEVSVLGIGQRQAPILGDAYWWSYKRAELAVLDRRPEGHRARFRFFNTWDGVQGRPVPDLTLTVGPAPAGPPTVRIGAVPGTGCPDVEEVVIWAPAPRAQCW